MQEPREIGVESLANLAKFLVDLVDPRQPQPGAGGVERLQGGEHLVGANGIAPPSGSAHAAIDLIESLLFQQLLRQFLDAGEAQGGKIAQAVLETEGFEIEHPGMLVRLHARHDDRNSLLKLRTAALHLHRVHIAFSSSQYCRRLTETQGKEGCHLGLRRIQKLAYFAGEAGGGVRLGQKFDARIQHAVMCDGIFRVAGGEEDFKIGIGGFQPLRHHGAAHSRHDDIGDDQGDRLALMLTGHAQGVLAVRGRQHIVTLGLQHPLGEMAHGRLVLHEQQRFRPPPHGPLIW